MNWVKSYLESNWFDFSNFFGEVKTGGESLELHLAHNVPRLDYSACRSAALQGWGPVAGGVFLATPGVLRFDQQKSSHKQNGH